MHSRLLFLLSVLVLAMLSIVAIGCSDNSLESGSQNISMTYTPSPSGSGRFDDAKFIVNTIEVVPTDANGVEVYEGKRLVLKYSSFSADLTSTQPVFFSNIALSAGPYAVTSIEYTPPALVDTNLAPNPATCMDGIEVFDESRTTGVPETFTFTDPPTLTFTIQPGQTSLALTIDVPGLIAGYQAAFTCSFVPCPGCPVDPRPTLSGTPFNTPVFEAALLANITIK